MSVITKNIKSIRFSSWFKKYLIRVTRFEYLLNLRYSIYYVHFFPPETRVYIQDPVTILFLQKALCYPILSDWWAAISRFLAGQQANDRCSKKNQRKISFLFWLSFCTYFSRMIIKTKKITDLVALYSGPTCINNDALCTSDS